LGIWQQLDDSRLKRLFNPYVEPSFNCIKMVNVILTHEVRDFAEWKKGFDAGEPMRAQAGVKTTGMYTALDNPNKVTVTTEFPSAEAVQGFLANPQLKADMEQAGVVGAPELHILNKVQ
jgi:hypothetical protein